MPLQLQKLAGGQGGQFPPPPKKNKKLEQKCIFLKYREESLKFAEITLIVNLKQWIVLNARVDWLVKFRISCAIYLRANREKWRRGLHR